MDSFFDSIKRIGARDYIPTDEDIIRARVKTTGITEVKFNVRDLVYRVFDVGGQRSERKKWIHCFEGVQCLIFIVAISEYDQVCNLIIAFDALFRFVNADLFCILSPFHFNSDSVRRRINVSKHSAPPEGFLDAVANMPHRLYSNRIDEASTLFESVANSRWFNQSSLVLFLNKTDLFREKLRSSPLNHYMPQYIGDNDWPSASSFMLNHFSNLLRNPNKRLYSHFTCATDKEQTRFVLSSLQDFIIKQNLAASGLI